MGTPAGLRLQGEGGRQARESPRPLLSPPRYPGANAQGSPGWRNPLPTTAAPPGSRDKAEAPPGSHTKQSDPRPPAPLGLTRPAPSRRGRGLRPNSPAGRVLLTASNKQPPPPPSKAPHLPALSKPPGHTLSTNRPGRSQKRQTAARDLPVGLHIGCERQHVSAPHPTAQVGPARPDPGALRDV